MPTSQVIPTSQLNVNTCECCSCLKRGLSLLHVNVSRHTTLQHAATPDNTHLRMLTCHVTATPVNTTFFEQMPIIRAWQCVTSHHAATRCNTLQHTFAHSNVSSQAATLVVNAAFLRTRPIIRACQRVKAHHAATRCVKLQHTTKHICAYQRVKAYHAATRCIKLQHTFAHANVLRHTTLQHTASNCNTLQHTFAHANVSRQAATLVEPPGALVDRFVHHFGLDRISQKSALL